MKFSKLLDGTAIRVFTPLEEIDGNSIYVSIDDLKRAVNVDLGQVQLMDFAYKVKSKVIKSFSWENDKNESFLNMNGLIYFINNFDNQSKKALSFQWVKSTVNVIKSVAMEEITDLHLEMIEQDNSSEMFGYTFDHSAFLLGTTRENLLGMLTDMEVLDKNEKIFYPKPSYANIGLFIHDGKNIFLTRKGLDLFSTKLPIEAKMMQLIYGRKC